MRPILQHSRTPLIRSPMGQKHLAILTGWPYYRGRLKVHDLRVVMTNTKAVHRIHISWTNVLIKKQTECKYRVQQLKEILQTDFPSIEKTLLKFGYKITTSALYVYCSLNTVQEQAQSTRSIKLTCHMHFNFLNFKQVAVLTGWNYKRFYCLGF